MSCERRRLLHCGTQTEFFRQPAQLDFFVGVKYREFVGDTSGDLGEKFRDEASPAWSETDRDETQIVGLAFSFDEADLFEIGDDEREVAGAFQEFGRERALTERAEMKQRFHNGELCDGEIGRESLVNPRGHGFGRPHQFDICIKGEDLVLGTLMMGWHADKQASDSLMSNDLGV